MAENTPLYNLKAVMREVSLSAATLRAWERRYGLLKPHRSPGGHRLYSRQDIEMLKWLVQKQNEGVSISQAVEMWKTLVEKPNLAPVFIPALGASILHQLREGWIAACKAFDDQAANGILDQAFATFSPEAVCTDVLQKGLAQVGEGWYAGSITVQQEHFASASAARRVNGLMAAAAPPMRAGRIIAACPPGEEHEFILLLVTYLLKRSGWDVVYLGANVPIIDLDATIQKTQPSLILSAAQTLESAASLRSMSEYLTTLNIPMAYGGGIFKQIPDAVHSISGYYLGTEIISLPQSIERLVADAPPIPTIQPVTRLYKQVSISFQQKEALIISDVTEIMYSSPIDPFYAQIAITHLTHQISSALILGDIHYLDYSVTWINGLLENYRLPHSSVRQLFEAYRLAIERHMRENAAIILDWMSSYQSLRKGEGDPRTSGFMRER